jgi:hypothetical protein
LLHGAVRTPPGAARRRHSAGEGATASETGRVLKFAFPVFLAAWLGLTSVAAAAAEGDARDLTSAERATFYPLLCRKLPALNPNPPACNNGQVLPPPAITYASFTRAGAAEAYVSYRDAGLHVGGAFGAGVLFARRGGSWELVHWVGIRIDRCAAIPGTNPIRFLCAFSSANTGDVESSVSVVRITPSGNDFPTTLFIKAEAHDGCPAASPGQPGLVAVIPPVTPLGPGASFAQIRVDYLTAASMTRDCANPFGRAIPPNNRDPHLAARAGVARFALRGGRIETIAPLPFDLCAAADTLDDCVRSPSP